MTRLTPMFLIGLAAACIGCRPELGTPVYDNAEDFDAIDAPPPEPKEGADPYQEGEERLSLGIFYEGGFSQEVPIDDVTTFFYIYLLESDSSPTFLLTPDTTIVEEGLRSDRIRQLGAPWWGGGVSWNDSRDISEYSFLYLSLRSEDPAFESVRVHILYGEEGEEGEGILDVADYGYVNDGQWHHIQLPLEDFAGVDWTAVTGPFSLIGDGGDNGEDLYVDNVYYAQD